MGIHHGQADANHQSSSRTDLPAPEGNMALPDCLEVVPLPRAVRAEITVPGSKSITNRALILAALARGRTTLPGALWSEDTQVMVDALRGLGFEVEVAADPEESGNRTLTVVGQGGAIPRGGTPERPLELFVGNAGTAARFLTALVCLGRGVCRLRGVPRMHERPQAALFAALRELGYRLDSPNDRLPVVIHGAGPQPGGCQVSAQESSQFASALLLAAPVGGWQVRVTAASEDELPYVEMTRELVMAFPKHGGSFPIEPDASSGSYFWAAGALVPEMRLQPEGKPEEIVAPDGTVASTRRYTARACLGVRVRSWPKSGWQIDARFPDYLPLPAALSRQSDLGDSILTAMILAPFAPEPIRFTDLGRLRVQECERVAAMRTELTRCGAEVLEQGDTLTVFPSAARLHGATVETHDDHRMAMSFAILGLKVPGIKLQNPACVKKTFPNFFQKLAARPPAGLGAELRDGRTQRPLSGEELIAG